MKNVKISSLQKTEKILDSAIIPIVQDNQNKVVTVKDLSEKMNFENRKLIKKLYEEFKENTYAGELSRLKDIIAKQCFTMIKMEQMIKRLQDEIEQLKCHSHCHNYNHHKGY